MSKRHSNESQSLSWGLRIHKDVLICLWVNSQSAAQRHRREYVLVGFRILLGALLPESMVLRLVLKTINLFIHRFNLNDGASHRLSQGAPDRRDGNNEEDTSASCSSDHDPDLGIC